MDDKKARAILDMAASEKAHIFKVGKNSDRHELK